jgi:hypothetical protein
MILAAVLATVIVAPCVAANENQSEDRNQGDVQTPGVTEPRTPDTLKAAPDQRIQNEGRASQEGTVGERSRALDERGLNEGKSFNEKKSDEKK